MIWDNSTEIYVLPYVKQMTSAGSMPEAGHLKLVLWDNPEGWGGEGDRREVQDGGTHVHLWLIHVDVWQKTPRYCKIISLQLKQIKSESEVAQSCPTLCNHVNCSPPGSSVHGILQARILEWVAISFSRGSSQPGDQTQVSRIAGRRFNLWATREAEIGEKNKWEKQKAKSKW